MYHSEPLSGNT